MNEAFFDLTGVVTLGIRRAVVVYEAGQVVADFHLNSKMKGLKGGVAVGIVITASEAGGIGGGVAEHSLDKKFGKEKAADIGSDASAFAEINGNTVEKAGQRVLARNRSEGFCVGLSALCMSHWYSSRGRIGDLVIVVVLLFGKRERKRQNHEGRNTGGDRLCEKGGLERGSH